MAQFLGVHTLPTNPPSTDEGSEKAFRNYQEEAKKMGLNALHAHYSIAKGFAYCLTEAADADQVRKAHANAGVPVDDVIEVKTID